MSFLKKIGAVCLALATFCCTTFTQPYSTHAFAAQIDETVLDTYEPKTIYNFNCYENISLSNILTTTSSNPVSGYIGYTDNFFVDPSVFEAFENATVICRNKGAATNITYNQPAYGNGGNLLDGKDGRDYFMSFDISSGATFYLVDNELSQWPSKPNNFKTYGNYGSSTIYGKHYNAGETVQIPCYGWRDSWDKTSNRLFMNPSYFVVVWDNDATADKFTYTLNNQTYTVTNFHSSDKGGDYNVEINYVKDGADLDVDLIANDPQATVSTNSQTSFHLDETAPVTVSYTVVSECGDNTYNFNVTFTMKPHCVAEVSVNPYIEEHFNAKSLLTNIYCADNAGKTTEQSVKMLTYDENGYARCGIYNITYIENSQTVTAEKIPYSELYNYIGVYQNAKATIVDYNYANENAITVQRGESFFTDSHYFGITGTAFDNASHIMTSRQYAPGRVNASSFNSDNSAETAAEFKAWLCNDENVMYTLTPNTDCVVYVAFSQERAKNHTKFVNDGWTFNNYENIKIPSEALLTPYKDIKKPSWWMVDSSYTYNGKPYVLTKIQYDQNSPTTFMNYCYIWSKTVKADESIDIPVGGSAFVNQNDQNAPKVLLNWSSDFLKDDVSGTLNIGSSSIKINNTLDSFTYNVVANVGDEISFTPSNGATAYLSSDIIDELPCETELKIVSQAGSSVVHKIKLRIQPQILNITPSKERDKFVSNTGSNEISLASSTVGTLVQTSVLFQQFEEDEDGILQPVYGSDGKYVFNTVKKTVGAPFYKDRTQHKFAHVGDAFKNMQYFTIPSNDSVNRRKTVYSNENTSYVSQNGKNKEWSYTNSDGTTSKLDYLQMSTEYENYFLSDSEYFSFTPTDSGTVYAAFETVSPNYTYANGWKRLTVNVPLPEGHSEWSSVEAYENDTAYPYQLGKIQYDAHKTEYHNFKYIYYRHFDAYETVSIPTTGIESSDVGAFMVDWNDFVSADFGGTLSFNENNINIRSDRSDYTIDLISDEDIVLDFTANAPGTTVNLSDTKILSTELPKTVTADITNYFGGQKTFNITFNRIDAKANRLINFDVVSEYGVYNKDNSFYNTDKAFNSFSEGVYMVEDDLKRGVSALYSDRLTHKFTAYNTSDMFEGATYIRRPKKSGDYGSLGISANSDFYSANNNTWIAFTVTSDADVYVAVPFDSWPNKPDDWEEDNSVELAGSKKVYKKSFSAGSYVSIPSHGWDTSWDKKHESWDLPTYVIVWR